MELIQIKYFHKVAQLQHMTNAARELHISQPALSKTIRQLEEELGITLFDRVGKSVQLNEAGHLFLNYAETLLSVLNEARTRMADYIENNAVTVSLSLRIAPSGIPDMLAQFRKLHPNVKFEVEQHQFLLNNFSVGKNDLMLYSSTEPMDADNIKTLFHDRIMLVVPQTHPVAAHESIPLVTIKDEKIIGSTPQDNIMNTCITTFCRQAGFSPKIVTVCDDAVTTMNFVRSEIGLGFLPESTIIGLSRFYPELRFISISEPRCLRYINMRWDNRRYLSTAAVQFREFLQQYYQDFQQMLDSDSKKDIALLSDFPGEAIS